MGDGAINDMGNYVPKGRPGSRWFGVAEMSSSGTVFINSGYFSPLMGGIRESFYYSDFWTLEGEIFSLWTDPIDSRNGQGACPPFDDVLYPPNTVLPATWTNGTDFWMFGGLSFAAFPATRPLAVMADLWQFSADTELWTWISAPNRAPCITNPSPDPSYPVGRYGSVSWELNGEFYMFGGQSLNGMLNDLWKFDGKWTQISAGVKNGNYVHQGKSSKLSFPRARAFASQWIDLENNIWIYGGVTEEGTVLDDLWRYDQTEWAWFSGSVNAFNIAPVYGQKSQFCSGMHPGSRQGAASWSDSKGRLWLFGGGISMNETYNDLWLLQPLTGQWAWISGSQTTNAEGDYNATNPFPGGLNFPQSWLDLDQNLVLYAGHTPQGAMNDMWKATISGFIDPCETSFPKIQII